MTDYMFKFSSEEEAKSVLFRYTYNTELGETLFCQGGDNFGLDNIGFVLDSKNNPADGWHVNLRILEDNAENPAPGYEVYPATPKVVWI